MLTYWKKSTYGVWVDWQSARVQAVMVCLNILVLLFVAGAGSYAGFKNGWKGYEQADGCVNLLSSQLHALLVAMN